MGLGDELGRRKQVPRGWAQGLRLRARVPAGSRTGPGTPALPVTPETRTSLSGSGWARLLRDWWAEGGQGDPHWQPGAALPGLWAEAGGRACGQVGE